MKALLLETYKGKEIIQYIELLERENKFLDEEGVAKCELNEKLSKALDRACAKLEHFDYYMNLDDAYTQEQWKAWCVDE
jgi:hypothetical protein